MILPLLPPSPVTPVNGTAAIRCAGRSTRGTDFEALLAQAGQIGSDIAALLGGSMTAGLPSLLPPAGTVLTGTGTGTGTGTDTAGAGAGAPAGLAIAAANTAQATRAMIAGPTAELAAEGPGQPGPAGASLPPGLAALTADGRLSPGSLPGRHGDGHPGHDINGRMGRATLPAMPASPAAPATPAPGADPGTAPAAPAASAVPTRPAEPGDLPASEVPSGPLPRAPAAPRPDTAPAPEGRGAAFDGLRAEPGVSTAAGGPGPVNSPAAAVSEAPETAVALPVRIAELARRRSGGTEHIVVRLDPPELGSVRISLTARGDQVHVVVRADTPEARAALDAQRGQVEQLLGSEGFDLSSFDVGHQRREHEQPGPHRTAPQDRITPDRSERSGSPARSADGALRL